MTSEIVNHPPITVTADDVRAVRRTADALQRLDVGDGSRSATILTPDGQAVEVAVSLVAALQQLASLLAQGDDVALVPVHKDVSFIEAADVLNVSRPFLLRLLTNNDIPSIGTGDDRRVRLVDLIAYKERRGRENKRDLATALAVVQEAGAYD